MPTKTTARPRALVTGASSGIGEAFAERLAKDGYDLIVVARRRERLEAIAKKLEEIYNVKVEVLAADLSQREDLHKVEKRIEADSQLELLVNNAGFGAYMPFVQLDPDKAEELINVQVLGLTRLTRAALPGMIQRGRGGIVNVSSRLGFSAPMGSSQLPKRATYAGAKAYMIAFTQLLQSELEGTGVQVQVLCPGVVRTEFHELVGADVSRFPPEIIMPVEEVIEASLAALKSGDVVCLPMLDDPALLTDIWDSQKRLFDRTRSGGIANRYKS